jgi:copper chaperone
MANVTLKIGEMSCGHCVSSVKQALKGLDGVDELKVDIGSAVLNYDPAKVSLTAIKDAVEEEGYPVLSAS